MPICQHLPMPKDLVHTSSNQTSKLTAIPLFDVCCILKKHLNRPGLHKQTFWAMIQSAQPVEFFRPLVSTPPWCLPWPVVAVEDMTKQNLLLWNRLIVPKEFETASNYFLLLFSFYTCMAKVSFLFRPFATQYLLFPPFASLLFDLPVPLRLFVTLTGIWVETKQSPRLVMGWTSGRFGSGKVFLEWNFRSVGHFCAITMWFPEGISDSAWSAKKKITGPRVTRVPAKAPLPVGNLAK